MKKVCSFIILLSFLSVLVSGCKINTQKTDLIQSKRRFAQYMEPQTTNNGSVIDLSEGPKQNYDGYLGPQKLDFDIKIIDPY